MVRAMSSFVGDALKLAHRVRRIIRWIAPIVVLVAIGYWLLGGR
jgi:hypothetical protein